MRADAILLAAGAGARFGGPKQWAPLLGRPVIRHSLDALSSLASVRRLVVVVPPGEVSRYRAILCPEDCEGRIVWAEGGATRRASVLAGLRALERADARGDTAASAVLVHDAARPYVGSRVVKDLLAALSDAGQALAGAVPVVPVADTLRWRNGRGGPDRESLWRVQTPQAFRAEALRRAHRWGEAHAEEADRMTDDASLVEALGGRIGTVPGDPRAEKITVPDDVAVAAVRLGGAPSSLADLRTGIGLDHHRLAAGRPLVLCGVRLPGEEGLVGHSDGDAALHAVANALLGAVGARDIGTLFPPDDPALAGLASTIILARAREAVEAQGCRVSHVHIVLTAPRPHLAPFVPAMTERLAELLDLPASAVAVHATTGEGTLQDAVEAHAVATVGRVTLAP